MYLAVAYLDYLLWISIIFQGREQESKLQSVFSHPSHQAIWQK